MSSIALDERDYYKEWKNSKTSVWNVIENTFKERDIDSCILMIEKLEKLTVPRLMYKGFYEYLVELSIRYGITEIGVYLFQRRRLLPENYKGKLEKKWSVINSVSKDEKDRSDILYDYYIESQDRYSEITSELIKVLYGRKDPIIMEVDRIIKNNSDVDLARLMWINTKIVDIGYYMIGLSGKDKLINIIKDNEGTILAMAEMGNEILMDIKDNIHSKLKEEVGRRLLINSHNDLYERIFGLEDKDTIFFYANPKLINQVVQRNDEVKSVEAFNIHMLKFKRDEYKQLEEDISHTRHEIVGDVFEIMEDMIEENRYKVYPYCMSIKIFMENESIEIKKAKLIYYAKNNETTFRELMEELNLNKEDIRMVIPNHPIFDTDRIPFEKPKPKVESESNMFIYWLLLLIVLFVSVLLIITILVYNKQKLTYTKGKTFK